MVQLSSRFRVISRSWRVNIRTSSLCLGNDGGDEANSSMSSTRRRTRFSISWYGLAVPNLTA
ncbi:hypothetical protein NC652_003606 [Populus alba x Populus x berolinensis]|uniref:Uncharacterized protein n=1 Tax=Populus alba x Populus x berolinensis TaxID=444605 RepID=A0AAD6RS23_9ROSI|nr:hypothetical protein NC652_003606 [Populus alba x Populus x berolinensis]KAJ7014115.1 hypothetical protein NC653_003664 [Populus alba x Populus x berolinensis]